VNREDDGRLAPRDGGIHGALDRLMVGLVVRVDPGLERFRLEPGIARHDQPIGDLHDERGIVEAAIGIDQKPREA
jgi:hypothetical protein